MRQSRLSGSRTPWTPSDYRDTYTDRVNDLIKAKQDDKEFEPASEAPAATNVPDLTGALQASVEAAKAARRGKSTSRSKGKASGASKGGPKSSSGKTTGQTGGKKSTAKTGSRGRQSRKSAA